MTEPASDPGDRRGLVRLFVERPVTSLMLTLAIVAVGLLAYLKLPLEFAPAGVGGGSNLGIWIPMAQARAPREVELKVVKPLEEQIRTIPGVKRIRSQCNPRNAQLQVEIAENLDPVLAAAELRDRIQRARLEWPPGVDRYFTWRETASNMPLAFFQMLAPQHNPEWDQLIDEVVKPRLESVDGVGRVDIWGLLDQSVRIWFDRDLLRAHSVDFRALVERLGSDNFTEPVGELDNGEERLWLRVDEKFRDLAEIEAFPVRPGLRLGDVARVERVPSVRDNLSRYQGKYTYGGQVRAAAGANPVATSNRLREATAALCADPRLRDLEFRFMFDQGEFIQDSLKVLVETSVEGAVLAFLVLWLFLRNIRLTLAISFAIPLTLLVVGAYLLFSGGSLNILSMAGMTLAIGMVVDNSVVVVENIVRLRAQGLPMRRACIRGANQVGLAVLLSTLSTVVVFLPIIFMGGDGSARAIFAALGLPLSTMLVASLFVALYLTPAALQYVHVRPPAAAYGQAPWWSPVGWLLSSNRWLLARALRWRWLSMLLVCVVTVVAWRSSPKLEMQGGSGMWGDRDLSINLELPRGFTLREVEQEVIGYETFLLAHKQEWRIDSVSSRFNRTSARLDLDLQTGVPKKQADAIGREVRAAWPRRPGVKMLLRNATDGGFGGEKEDDRGFVLRLFGRDSEYLSHLGSSVALALQRLPEVESVDTKELDQRDEVVVDLDRERIQDLGVRPDVVLGTLASGLQGRELTRFEEAGREVRLIAQFDSEHNPSLVDLKETQVYSRNGTFQRLADLGDVRIEKAIGSVHRLDGKTSLSIIGRRAEGVGPRAFRTALDNLMRQLPPLPRGYSWSEESPSRDSEMEVRKLVQAGALSVTLVFLLMGVLFEAVILPAAILVTIPLALWGAWMGLWLFMGTFDLMAVIGMILLAGVVVNNGIVLLDCIERLRRGGMAREAAILEGTRQRLRPIFMTALTTIVGMLPMAILGESAGQGLSYVGMSIAVSAGLGLATVVTAFAVPLAYTLMDDCSAWLRGAWHRAGAR